MPPDLSGCSLEEQFVADRRCQRFALDQVFDPNRGNGSAIGCAAMPRQWNRGPIDRNPVRIYAVSAPAAAFKVTSLACG